MIDILIQLINTLLHLFGQLNELGGALDDPQFLPDTLRELTTITVLASGISVATPYLFATLGETFGQRSGVLNLGVEGVMLMGAFMSFWAVYEFTPDNAESYYVGALALGMLAAIGIGLLMGLATAFINVTLQAEQGISGIGIYLFGLGMSELLLNETIDEVALIKGFPAIDFGPLSDIPFLGDVIFDHNLMVYLAFLMVPVTWFVLNRTTLGLKIRAVGQNPEAADTMGISVTRVRYFTVTLGCVMASIAGATLSIAQHNAFRQNMTAGMGFIAVALVYFGAWRARGVMFGALLFSLVTAFQVRANTADVGIPIQFLSMAPYALTIIALIVASQRIDTPAALTKPFERGH